MFYFFNYNFKVGHEPWTCVNPLILANPQNLASQLFSSSFPSFLLFTLYFDRFVILIYFHLFYK